MTTPEEKARGLELRWGVVSPPAQSLSQLSIPVERLMVAVGVRDRLYGGFMMLAYLAEMDFACIYAMRRPRLARKCALEALKVSVEMGRPDLSYRARDLLAVL